MLYRHGRDWNTTNLVVIGMVCTGSCENYQTITSTTAPYLNDNNIDIYVDFLQVSFLVIISLKNDWKFKCWLTMTTYLYKQQFFTDYIWVVNISGQSRFQLS